MKALVTGSTGFIGSHLVEELIRRGLEVSCLVRNASVLKNIKDLRVPCLRAEYEDQSSLQNAIQGQDYIFHCAAVISALDWQSYFQANVCATRNLIEACWRKNPFLKKFVFISSISATGPSPKGIALNEESPCRPISDYGRSKLQAEQVVWEYKDKLPVTVIRPPNVIGPRQKELFQATQLIKRRILPLVGSGSPQTSLCSVFDLVEALCLVAEKPESSAQVYFVTDSRAYAWKEISEAIAEALGVRSFLFKVPYGLQYMIAAASETRARLTGCDPLLTRQSVRSARKYDWIYDDTKIRKDLGFSHHWTLKETIRQTIRWYKESGAL